MIDGTINASFFDTNGTITINIALPPYETFTPLDVTYTKRENATIRLNLSAAVKTMNLTKGMNATIPLVYKNEMTLYQCADVTLGVEGMFWSMPGMNMPGAAGLSVGVVRCVHGLRTSWFFFCVAQTIAKGVIFSFLASCFCLGIGSCSC